MKADITFAIIGCGRIGSRHAEHINRLANLIAVCDIDITKADTLAQTYNVNSYHSIEKLFANEARPDVVAVCTPNGLHAQHTILSLRASCHVVCGKPMAINSLDCLQMMSVAEQLGKQLFIVKQNRFNNAVIEVKDLLTKGKLGRIYSFQVNCFWNRKADYYFNNWHGTKDLDGGTLFTQFSHFIDILYWFLGDVDTVQSFLKNTAHQNQISFEDTGTAILAMQNGAIGTLNYTVNSYGENMEGSITLFGEKGTVKIGGQYLNTIAYQHIENITIPIISQQPANDYGSYKGSMSNHHKVYENVIDVLCNGAAISTSAKDGFKTVEIIEKIYAANTL